VFHVAYIQTPKTNIIMFIFGSASGLKIVNIPFFYLFNCCLLRNKTFRNAEVRQDDMYFDWPDPQQEHPTQFYPAYKIFRYPKKYKVKDRYCIALFSK
jgi:hypothetical protein